MKKVLHTRVDAFSISRASQTGRLESIMTQNNMFSSGKLIPKSDIPLKDKAEITNIMNYMNQMGHTSKTSWLPSDYDHYRDFRLVFGFEQQYGTEFPGPTDNIWYNGMIDQSQPIDIEGYEIALRTVFHNNTFGNNDFELGGKAYKLNITYLPNNDVEISIVDSTDLKQAEVTLKPMLEKLFIEHKPNKGLTIPPTDLTVDSTGSALKMRVILQNFNFRKETGKDVDEINGDALVLVGEK